MDQTRKARKGPLTVLLHEDLPAPGRECVKQLSPAVAEAKEAFAAIFTVTNGRDRSV